MTQKTKTQVAAEKLSASQIAGLKALSPVNYQRASHLGVASSTMTSLVKLGFATVKWMDSSYREPKTGIYRITGMGICAMRYAAKAAV